MAKRQTKNISISLDPDLLDAAKKKADSELRNFSNYLSILIKRDLEEDKEEKKA